MLHCVDLNNGDSGGKLYPRRDRIVACESRKGHLQGNSVQPSCFIHEGTKMQGYEGTDSHSGANEKRSPGIPSPGLTLKFLNLC